MFKKTKKNETKIEEAVVEVKETPKEAPKTTKGVEVKINSDKYSIAPEFNGVLIEFFANEDFWIKSSLPEVEVALGHSIELPEGYYGKFHSFIQGVIAVDGVITSTSSVKLKSLFGSRDVKVLKGEKAFGLEVLPIQPITLK